MAGCVLLLPDPEVDLAKPAYRIKCDDKTAVIIEISMHTAVLYFLIDLQGGQNMLAKMP